MRNKIKKTITTNRIERSVIFVASVMAIATSLYAITAINDIKSVYSIPKTVIDFCPSIIGAGGACNNADIRNTCGEEKKSFILSCEGENNYLQIRSDIYNKGSALATNIEMKIQFEKDTLLAEEGVMLGVAVISENGITREERIACQDTCMIRTTIPILKPSDYSKLIIQFNRGDFKEKPKLVKFILYQDGKKISEKLINISYEKQDFSGSRAPQHIDGIISYRNKAANNATVFVKKLRTNETISTITNELGQYIVDLSNTRSYTFYKDHILVKACFKNSCSEQQIEANTLLGANEVNINIE